MIKATLVSIVIAFVIITPLQAQQRFFSTVKIEFEKTVSVRQLMKDMEEGSSWFEENKDRYPVSVLSYYNFTGDTSRSVYQPGKEVPMDIRSFYRPIADKNIVFTDYIKRRYIAQKPVYEETFLVDDSLLKIKWKLTNDVRSIAGFDCRKAIGVLNDSISIFAFYTDEILINGGPEGIQGLPGMILGAGIPRLHATWFATKVEVSDIKMDKVMPATKGKKVTRAAMIMTLNRIAKDWGTYGSKLLINFII